MQSGGGGGGGGPGVTLTAIPTYHISQEQQQILQQLQQQQVTQATARIVRYVIEIQYELRNAKSSIQDVL